MAAPGDDDEDEEDGFEPRKGASHVTVVDAISNSDAPPSQVAKSAASSPPSDGSRSPSCEADLPDQSTASTLPPVTPEVPEVPEKEIESEAVVPQPLPPSSQPHSSSVPPTVKPSAPVSTRTSNRFATKSIGREDEDPKYWSYDASNYLKKALAKFDGGRAVHWLKELDSALNFPKGTVSSFERFIIRNY